MARGWGELTILHRDDDLAAVAKPSGLLVHPTTIARDRRTCLQMLRDQLGCHVHPIHRLDRGASGVLLFALHPEAARALSTAFAAREVTKSYVALARGYLPEAIEVDHPVDNLRGRPGPALTSFRRLAIAELPEPVGRYATARYSLVLAEPRTGRLHQIRRHLSHLRHPIVGDASHGDRHHNRFFRERLRCRRLLLHALALGFRHPRTGEEVAVRCPLPPEFVRIAGHLGWDAVHLSAADALGGEARPE